MGARFVDRFHGEWLFANTGGGYAGSAGMRTSTPMGLSGCRPATWTSQRVAWAT
jgi:hypothetical protein